MQVNITNQGSEKMTNGSEVDTMQNIALKEQRRDMQALSDRLSQVERQVAELLGRISSLTNIGKAVIVMAAAAVGIDVVQMGGA